MVMLRDELMAEVGGGMEEDRESGSGGNPSTGRRRHGPKCEDVFAHFCLRYQQLLFWHIDFVLVCT